MYGKFAHALYLLHQEILNVEEYPGSYPSFSIVLYSAPLTDSSMILSI